MHSSVETENIKRYKVLDQELYRINNEKISPVHSRDACKRSFNFIFPEIRDKLCDIEPFFKQYKLDTYQGSSYEGLSVGKNYKEFDMNIHIKLDSYVIKPSNICKAKKPGYVTLKMDIKNRASQIPDIVKVYMQWMDEQSYLLPSKFYRWGESVMQRMLEKFSLPGHKIKSMSKSGPAFTLHIYDVKAQIEYDVDIVFVLSFDSWHLGKWNGEPWIAVAKPMEGSGEVQRCWRYSLPNYENKLLNDRKHLKNAIRLIKQVRDICEMSYIASYYIKTLFMWEVEQKSSDFWEKSLGFIFVHMLYKLLDALDKEKIWFYYDKNANLLDRCSEDQLIDGYNRINSVLEDIESVCDRQTPREIRSILLGN